MAKRKAKHQSFKLSPHDHSRERVVILVLAALAVGVIVGLMLQDKAVEVLGVASY